METSSDSPSETGAGHALLLCTGNRWTLDRKKAGEFRTFPTPGRRRHHCVRVVAKTGSTSDVLIGFARTIPLFYMNMGDFHYLNIPDE